MRRLQLLTGGYRTNPNWSSAGNRQSTLPRDAEKDAHNAAARHFVAEVIDDAIQIQNPSIAQASEVPLKKVTTGLAGIYASYSVEQGMIGRFRVSVRATAVCIQRIGRAFAVRARLKSTRAAQLRNRPFLQCCRSTLLLLEGMSQLINRRRWLSVDCMSEQAQCSRWERKRLHLLQQK